MDHLKSHSRRCNERGRALYHGLVLQSLLFLSFLLLSLVSHGWLLREEVYFTSLGNGGQKCDHWSVRCTLVNLLELDRLGNPVQEHMSNDSLHQCLTKEQVEGDSQSVNPEDTSISQSTKCLLFLLVPSSSSLHRT